jgi:hypothetical protein
MAKKTPAAPLSASAALAAIQGNPLSAAAIASQPAQLAAASAVAAALAAKQAVAPGSFLTQQESSAATAPGYTWAPPTVDWSNVLGVYGLPPDVITAVNNIWATSGFDVTTAEPLIMSYLRGTSWYAQTYPGIQQGEAAGLFSDEQGYVAYESQVNTLYKQYYGRNATAAEVAAYVKSGQSISQIGNLFQSQAFQGNISDPLKGIFTQQELQAYSDEQSGIDSALGQKVTAEANLYTQLSPMFQTFYGRAPTRAELDGFYANGTQPSQISQQLKASGYLDAINPVIKGLFTPDELQQMATEAAGGDTPQGKQLTDMANLATQLNEVYQTFYGSSVTRDELNQAYTSGYTAQHVQSMLASGVYSNSLPANVKSLFTQDELTQAGQEASGLTQTAAGERILNIVKGAGSYASLATQYGQTLTSDQLKQFYDQGFSANDYGNHLQGMAWSQANSPDIQQTEGAFGTGQLSPQDLSTLGDEHGGLDTTQGQALTTAYNKALQRMNGVFQGTLARSGLTPSLLAPKPPTSQSSDVAA